MPRRLAAEVIATFILVFGGTGVVVIDGLSGGKVTLPGIALTWGLLVAVLVYAVGPVSGAHLNPAVTLGLAAARLFRWAEVPGYILAQCAGALAASCLLAALTAKEPGLGLGPTKPFRPEWVVECFVLEVWLTGVLMYVVLSLGRATPAVQALGGLVVGGVICLEVLFAGPVTGASMNPARSLAPAVVGANFDYLWIYLTAPPLGALLAVPAWRLTHPPATVS